MRLVVVLCLAAGSAPAQPGPNGLRHVTADGVALALPAVAALDCPAMRAKLDEIDASGYRDGSPLPKHEADMALLDYENRLSGAYFTRCLRSDARAAEPGSAFVRGFSAVAD
jgi:hypothetical protein